MNMPLRTYERFEAGETRLNLDHIHRFSIATRSDPHAILLAVATGSPALARRCADNQFGTILVIALQKFDEAVGDGLGSIEAREAITAVIRMFDDLAEPASASAAKTWLADGAEALRARRPRPGR